MEKVRTAALAMPEALEDYPFGENITVFRIFNRKGPIFAIVSEEKRILNVRVSTDFFEISDSIEGFTRLKVWKNWIAVDLSENQNHANSKKRARRCETLSKDSTSQGEGLRRSRIRRGLRLEIFE